MLGIVHLVSILMRKFREAYDIAWKTSKKKKEEKKEASFVDSLPPYLISNVSLQWKSHVIESYIIHCACILHCVWNLTMYI